MTLSSLSECSVKSSLAIEGHNTRSVGKIELLLPCQFKSVTSLREEDAVPRKKKRPQQIQTILRSKLDRRVEAWPKIPSIGLTRRPAPGRSRGRVVRSPRCTPAWPSGGSVRPVVPFRYCGPGGVVGSVRCSRSTRSPCGTDSSAAATRCFLRPVVSRTVLRLRQMLRRCPCSSSPSRPVVTDQCVGPVVGCGD